MAGNTLRIGNVEVMALIDCTAKAPCTALFPKLTEEDWAPFCDYLVDDCKNLPMTIPSFVLRSGGKTILIDSGIGAKDRPFFPNGRLPDALREAGVPVESIDIVFATHIHIDHVGWHTTAQGEGFVPTFPNATYVFARDEFEFFTATEQVESGRWPWVPDCVLPLVDQAPIELIDAEAKLTDDLTLIPTPGHTPAHSAVSIMSNGESAVIIGDVCHHPAQITMTDWSPLFDLNPVLAAQSREKLMQRLENEDTTVIGGHFEHPGFGRIVQVDGRRTWRAL